MDGSIILSAVITLTVAGLSYFVGRKNARTNQFSALINAYDKLASDMREELEAAKSEIQSLRREVSECHRIIEQLRGELARYRK